MFYTSKNNQKQVFSAHLRAISLIKTGLALLLLASLTLFPRLSFADYKIGSGDVIEITIWRFEDISGTFKVTSEGTINHFLIGSVRVAGLSAEEVRQKITEILASKYIRDPRVKVSITEHHNLRIFLMGEVSKPGMIELDREISILEAIIMAGGPTEKAGNVVTLFRENGREPDGRPKLDAITADLSDLLLKKDGGNNLILLNNDVLLVSSDLGAGFADRVMNTRLNRFYVVGQIKNVGSFPYVRGYRVLNGILEAGGLAEFADPNSTRVVRTIDGAQTYFEIRLRDILIDGDMTTNIEILPGDLIIVPKGIF